MSEPLDLLVFGAHADDAEIGMGGTIILHTAAGQRVGVCDLTQAEMSSNGTVETRRKEANMASKALGLSVRTNLGLPDRGLSMCREQIEAITKEIRTHRPRIVFAPFWEDRHPDHVLCSRLVQEAVFNAKLRKYMPDIPAFPVDQLLFYYINDTAEPDIMVDITSVYERKTESLRAYRTQFEQPDGSNGFVATPLNNGYLERVEARDRLLGIKRQIGYAEGFASRLPVLVGRF